MVQRILRSLDPSCRGFINNALRTGRMSWFKGSLDPVWQLKRSWEQTVNVTLLYRVALHIKELCYTAKLYIVFKTTHTSSLSWNTRHYLGYLLIQEWQLVLMSLSEREEWIFTETYPGSFPVIHTFRHNWTISGKTPTDPTSQNTKI
jgi:hypothetical protein